MRADKFGYRCGVAVAAASGLLFWPMTCGAQMVGPTPQPQGIPITPEQAEQVQQETWAIHGQATDRKSVV